MSGSKLALVVSFLLLLAPVAHADVVCVKTVGNERPLNIRAGNGCKVNETMLGSFDAFQKLLAASFAADDGATLQFTGNLQIASPVGNDSSPAQAPRVRSASAAAPPLGEPVRYCQGGGFPGEVGGQFACATNADCTGICVAGEDSVLGGSGGYTCTADFQCNSRLQNDGVCAARTATCQEFALLSVVGGDVFFSGFNVHVRSGSGATDGPVNGRGNLIVGYNAGSPERTGSHNLVVGDLHSYTSFGGLVAGRANTISGASATVSGGFNNVASGIGASVSGGQHNRATGELASVSGGHRNLASDLWASVSGGEDNVAQSIVASVSGGSRNSALAFGASVCGGQANEASGFRAVVSGGGRNIASGTFASVSGGVGNVAGPGALPAPQVNPGDAPAVSGGQHNQANATAASISGGEFNRVGPPPPGVPGVGIGTSASVSGGRNNLAFGTAASVSGGNVNFAAGEVSSVSGGESNRAEGGAASVSGGRGRTALGANNWVAGALSQDF